MLAKAKQLIKSSTFGVAHRTGALSAYVRRRLADRAVVLMYHRVLPRPLREGSFSADGIVVTPETFRLHMRLLSSHFRPLSVGQLAAVLSGDEALPERACVVTFDDGWWDNLEYALPVLEEFGVPAVVFVAADFIGTSRTFWQEHLSYMLFTASHAPSKQRDLWARLGIPNIGAMPLAERRVRIREYVTSLKSQSASEIQGIVAYVEQRLRDAGVEQSRGEVDRFLTWPEVLRLSASGLVTIGSHCRSHTPLPKLTPAAVAGELNSSRDIIAQHIGGAPLDLAYPNGDYTSQIAAETRAAGYRTAFTTERGYVRCGDNAWQLRRMNVHEGSSSTEPAFLARLGGLV